jgi:hypothetical protein
VLKLTKEYGHWLRSWDPTDLKYKLINNINNAWKEIADAFKCDSVQIMETMDLLLAAFRDQSTEKKKRSMKV